MNKILLIGLVVLILIGAIVMLINKQKTTSIPQTQQNNSKQNQDATPSKQQTKEESISKNTIEIKNFAFSPKTIIIKKGASVTFINRDAIGHSATADEGSFDTEILQQNQSKTVTFDKTGSFSYHCTPHPNMKATVDVE